MKTFTKTLALTLLATTAVQAMNNQPQQVNWKYKVKQLVPGPGKLAVAATTIAIPILSMVNPIAGLATIPALFSLIIGPDSISKNDIKDIKEIWNKKWSFQLSQLDKIHSGIQKGYLEAPPAGWTEKYNQAYGTNY